MEALEAMLAGIEDIKTLKSKRSTHKGNLKHLSNRLHGLHDTPLDRLRHADLKRKLESVTDNISAFDLIQDRVDDLSTDDAFANDEADVMEQRRMNFELLESYQEYVEAAKAWHTGDGLQDRIQDLLDSDVSGPYQRQKYEQVNADFEEFRRTSKRLHASKELSRLKDILRPLIHEVGLKMAKDLHIHSDSSTTSRSSDGSPAAATSAPYHSKLKLELPKFSGDVFQWKAFWNLFSTVLEREHLSDYEKICHLQSAMRTEEAKLVVRHAAGSGCYDDVVTSLKKRYDQHRMVHSHHVHALQHRTAVHHTSKDITQAIQEMQLHRSGLAETRGDTLDQFLTASTVLLMDSTCTSHWGNYTNTISDLPDLKTLLDLFESRLTTL